MIDRPKSRLGLALLLSVVAGIAEPAIAMRYASRIIMGPLDDGAIQSEMLDTDAGVSIASTNKIAAAQRVELEMRKVFDDHARASAAALTPSWHFVPLRSAIVAPAWMTPGQIFSSSLRFSPVCGARGYRPSGLLQASAEQRRRSYFNMVRGIACDYGLPLGLFDALIIRESGYNATVYSPKLAYGLTQLMSGTARSLGVNRYDIEGNLRGGARYLRQQLDRYGQYHLALAAYNAGPGRVRTAVPAITETQLYVNRVLRAWSMLESNERAESAFGTNRAASLLRY